MSAVTRSVVASTRQRSSGIVNPLLRSSFQYGRSPAYRRISSLHHIARPLTSSRLSNSSEFTLSSTPTQIGLTSKFLPESIAAVPFSKQSPFPQRHFHSRSSLSQQPKPKEEDIDEPPPPRQEAASEQARSESAESSSGSAKEDQGKNSESENRQEQEQNQEQESGDKEQGQEKKEAPPPHGDKSPWQVFTETLRTEFKASKEWNESTKALASSAHDFTQNETLKRARSAYGAASDVATSTTAKAFKTTGKAIGQSAAWTWDTLPVKGIRASVNATGRGIEKITRPVRETAAFKSVKDVIDDGSSTRYGGWMDKEQRKKIRETRDLQDAAVTGRPRRPLEPMEEDPEAGTNVTLHKDAAWKESWRNFRDSSRVMQSIFTLKSTYNESENPLITTARSISDRVAGFFAENETAMVIKKFREMDPSFQLEPFLRDMREYILPEVLDAYVKADLETLKLWLSDAQFQVYNALMHQYSTAGLKSDGRILDIRHVDVLSARMIDPGEIPVFILTCRTQEVHVYRNIKTEELAAGMEDRVQQVTYAIGVTRIPEDVSNPETRGWRLIELQKSARDYM